ncbi:MAG: hypothetical protein PWP44_334 [Thermacetogenium sp.]|jgi:hypothetical protein|nr:hypothetical protein [Thermacetogenium sp.]
MRNEPSLTERILPALLVGTAGFVSGIFLLDMQGIKALGLGDRAAAALIMGWAFLMLLAGTPAGWLAGKYSVKLPFILAWAGAFAPMVAWFAGMEAAWPESLIYAWLLAFAGSWVGLGLGLVLCRKKAEH